MDEEQAEKTTEKIIDEVLKCAIISSEQERARSNILLTKSDYLMKYISAAFVIVNAISAFAISGKYVPTWLVCAYYLVTGILLLQSMYFAIYSQILLNVKYFPTGIKILNGLAKRWHDEGKQYTVQEVRTDSIKYYSEYAESLETTNNDRAENLQLGYDYFMIATIVMVIGFLIFIVVIA